MPAPFMDRAERTGDGRAALQAILDLPCPFGREGEPLAKAQRIASEAITALNRAERAGDGWVKLSDVERAIRSRIGPNLTAEILARLREAPDGDA